MVTAAQKRATETEVKRRALFAICEDIMAALHAIDDADGEITEEQGRALDALGLELDDKAQAYVVVCRQLEADADACRAVAGAFAKRAAMHERRSKLLRARLFDVMRAAQRTDAGGAVGVASIAKNSAPTIELAVAPGDVPERFLTCDMKLVRQAVKDNDAEALALVTVTYGEHLRFR